MLFQKEKLPKHGHKYNTEFIVDIKDGQIYRDFLGHFTTQQIQFLQTLIINTDGIDMCEKSDLSFGRLAGIF